ncbi:MAG TPA: hypothetical protein VM580_33410 [Labilithrix sp.]|nr:hypothetical protein [Labilithrix sp.]
MLLLQQHRDNFWTAESVGRKLNISKSGAAEALDHLCRNNLLDVRIGEEVLAFRYRPGTPTLAQSVKSLTRLYKERRSDILDIVSTNASERLRAMAIRRLRRNDPK